MHIIKKIPSHVDRKDVYKSQLGNVEFFSTLQKRSGFENCLFCFAAISLGISDLLQRGHGPVSVTEEEGEEERGSTKEEIAEKEDQRPGEGPKVAIPSA